MAMLTALRRDPFSVLCRKKPVATGNESVPLLKRCLSFFDLLMLEIGCMIGAGIFIVVGSSIKDKSGAGVLLSYVIAGIPSFIAALCYAEFGARIPRAGSTYDFVYVTLGEFWAAMVGWFYVSSGIFWIAADALAWSSYFDTLLNNMIRNKTMETIDWFHTPYLAQYPDFFACLIIVLFSLVVAIGAKSSAIINNILSFIKMIVIVFIVIYGLTLSDIRNWTDSDRGGFLPYGFTGVIAAAPDCFLSFVGFDAATMAGEEAKDPGKNVALAIGSAFVVVILAYVLMCTSLTLMLPYKAVSSTASFADAFQALGSPWSKYVVAVGALSALSTILFGTIFSLPRYIYAVSSDGLVFEWLGRVNKRTGVPVLAIVVYCIMSIVVTLLFDLNALIEFLSLGMLLCYTLVPASVIVIRYRPTGDDTCCIGRLKQKYTRLGSLFGRFQPGDAVIFLVLLQAGIMFVASAMIAYANWDQPVELYTFMIILSLLAMVLLAVQLLISAFQQNDQEKLWFRVPLVPWLPSIAMFMNILMILYLKPITWLRFAIYLSLGVLLYFVYGIRHSRQNKSRMIHEKITAAEQKKQVQRREDDDKPDVTKL